jgi:hypothetical protein
MRRFSKFYYFKHFLLLFFLLPPGIVSFAQEEKIKPAEDSLLIISESRAPVKKERKDSSVVKPHSPRTAAIRSALVPGLGQIYNKKYWKLPLVYGALGTTAGIFAFNLRNYRDTRFAYSAKYKASLPPPLNDSTDYFKIRPELMPLSLESLRFYRNQYRRDIDYSVFFFLLAWALNVADATVDAHLKTFDVSPDLSLRIVPGHSELAGTTGISIVLIIRKNKSNFQN